MRKLAYLPFLLLLTACASLGLQQPQSFDQRLAYAYGTNTAIRSAAASALTAKTIQRSDAEYALKTTDEARTALDTARVAYGAGDIQTAEGRLLLVTGILRELQTYLNARNKP